MQARVFPQYLRVSSRVFNPPFLLLLKTALSAPRELTFAEGNMEKDNSGEGISKGSTWSRLLSLGTAALLVLDALAASINFNSRAVAQEADREKVTLNGEAEILSPPFLTSEDALKKWVEDIIRDAPPAGGMVTMPEALASKICGQREGGKDLDFAGGRSDRDARLQGA